MMRLLLFGQIRESAAGLHGSEIASAPASVRDLLAWIDRHHHELGRALDRPGVRFAVDQRFADLETEIGPHSEVALMSPLSGG
jgi:molybdopterin converting factor small subunit